jgi:hypothetical protein
LIFVGGADVAVGGIDVDVAVGGTGVGVGGKGVDVGGIGVGIGVGGFGVGVVVGGSGVGVAVSGIGVSVAVGCSGVDVGGSGVDVAAGASDTAVGALPPHPTENIITKITAMTNCSTCLWLIVELLSSWLPCRIIVRAFDTFLQHLLALEKRNKETKPKQRPKSLTNTD